MVLRRRNGTVSKGNMSMRQTASERVLGALSGVSSSLASQSQQANVYTVVLGKESGGRMDGSAYRERER